jgi:hypothetical protein
MVSDLTPYCRNHRLEYSICNGSRNVSYGYIQVLSILSLRGDQPDKNYTSYDISASAADVALPIQASVYDVSFPKSVYEQHQR